MVHSRILELGVFLVKHGLLRRTTSALQVQRQRFPFPRSRREQSGERRISVKASVEFPVKGELLSVSKQTIVSSAHGRKHISTVSEPVFPPAPTSYPALSPYLSRCYHGTTIRTRILAVLLLLLICRDQQKYRAASFVLPFGMTVQHVLRRLWFREFADDETSINEHIYIRGDGSIIFDRVMT